MASKWAGLKGKLPAFEQPPDWQAKVDALKSQYVGLDATEMAREFAMQRRIKQNYEENIKETNTAMEALSQLLVQDLEGSELQKIQLATGETCYISSEPYASIEDKPKFMAWIRKSKMTSMLTLPWQTMNAVCKERLADGRALPPGVKCFLKTSARVRGGNGSED